MGAAVNHWLQGAIGREAGGKREVGNKQEETVGHTEGGGVNNR